MKIIFQTDNGPIESNDIELPRGDDGPKIISCSIEDYVEPTT